MPSGPATALPAGAFGGGGPVRRGTVLPRRGSRAPLGRRSAGARSRPGVVTSTRLSWSSSSAVAIWWCLASLCTVLSGTCVPELPGLIAPSSVREGDRQPERGEQQEQRERIAQGDPAGALQAKSPRITSTGLRRWARPERTGGAAVAPAAVGAPVARRGRRRGRVLGSSELGSSVMSDGLCGRGRRRRRSTVGDEESAPCSAEAVTRAGGKAIAVHKNDTSATSRRSQEEHSRRICSPRFSHTWTPPVHGALTWPQRRSQKPRRRHVRRPAASASVRASHDAIAHASASQSMPVFTTARSSSTSTEHRQRSNQRARAPHPRRLPDPRPGPRRARRPRCAKRLIIGGSTSVLPLAQKLATAYHQAFPKIPAPKVEGGQSDIGISGAASGRFDIGDSSRDPIEHRSPQGSCSRRSPATASA